MSEISNVEEEKEKKDVIYKVRDLVGRELYSVLITTAKGKPYRSPNKAYNHLVDQVNKELKYKKFEAIQWFFTNTARSLRDNYMGFSVKLQSAYWTGNDCGISARGINSVLGYMSENEYIYVLKGSHDYRNEDFSYMSVVRFNQKLVDLFDKKELELHVPSVAMDYPIILKDRKTKEMIEVEKTGMIDRMAQEMARYNESLSSVDIRFNGKEVPLLEYHRSFSGDFNSGGRLFAHGGSIQLVPQELRLSAITIEGESVQEWDYSANHPRILLEILSKKEPQILDLVSKDVDPYGADESCLRVDHVAVEEHKLRFGIKKYNPARSFMKHAVMRALNCDSFDRAWSSLSHELFTDGKKNIADREYVGLIKPDTKQVLMVVCAHNHLISKDFFQDKGIWLQNLDSEIALRVIDLMLQSGEVVLCWHDSFQCRASAGELLHSAMVEAWNDVIGSKEFVKVDQK